MITIPSPICPHHHNDRHVSMFRLVSPLNSPETRNDDTYTTNDAVPNYIIIYQHIPFSPHYFFDVVLYALITNFSEPMPK